MILKRYTLLILLIILLIISCQSDKTPLWVTDPPADDELNIYIVGIGIGDEVYDSVLSQLYERFNIKKNDIFSKLIISVLLDIEDENISIIDTWSSDTLDYVLVRFKRSFFDPILDLYTTRFDEMMNFSHEFEVEGDVFYDNGELYSAYSLYLKALDEMLLTQDEFYTPAILKVIKKIEGILNQIRYMELETFSELIIGKPINEEKLYFKVSNSDILKFSGFLFKVSFKEGWNLRKRSAIIPVRNNSFIFVPPMLKKSGTYTIDSSLYVDDLIVITNRWKDHDLLSKEIQDFQSEIESIIKSSRIDFEFNLKSDLNSFNKIISFDNELVTEGILRFLIEIEDNSVVSPINKGNELFESYIREVNRITDSGYQYMILGDEIKRDIITFDENGILIKLSSKFYLVDMNTTLILQTQSIDTEFLGVLGEEELAYLDFGLKVGEVIYSMKF